MNWGSLLSFHESCRCGANPNARQIRDTADCDIPSSAASDRVDQCVASFGVVSRVRVITASTWSSTTERGRPGRGSSSNPSRRSTTNRERHLPAVVTETPSFAAIAVLPNPSAANTIRDRTANAFALFARRAHATNCTRSSSARPTTGASGVGLHRKRRARRTGMRHTSYP